MKNALISLKDNIPNAILHRATGSWMSLTTDHWTSCGEYFYTGMMDHYIEKRFELQNRFFGCWLHEVDYESQTFKDKFFDELFKKCKTPTANVVAVVSDTTSNMNKFGTFLEKWISRTYTAQVTLG